MAEGTDTGLLSPIWAGTGVDELVSDEAWLRAMLDAEVALAKAQARLRIIPEEAVGPIAACALAERLDLVALARRAREAANPVVALVQALTAEVKAQAPEAAEYVHRGGTSQDILDSAAMLLSARALGQIDADLVRCASGLARLADEYRAFPMAGRTLTQHAVPVTFGLKAAGWLTLVLDALDRVRRTARSLPAQLGGAAGTLASYNEYATSSPAGDGPGHPLAAHGLELLGPFAGELGLAEPLLPWHGLRTPLADLGATLGFVAGALGKFAIDVLGMARTEVGEVAEPGADGRGVSSAMPQKRNPVLASLIMAAARQVPPMALILTQCLVSEDERSAGGWHAEWQPLRECLRLTAGAAVTAAELAGGLVVIPERLRENMELSDGAIVSERLGAVLAPLLGKAAAKQVLARISRAAAEGSVSFRDLLVRAPELQGHFTDPDELLGLLEPANYLGASDILVQRALDRYRATTS